MSCAQLPSSAALADNPGRFRIVDAVAQQNADVWQASSQADLVLSEEALDALQNSVALTIQYQFEVTRRRKFWPDKTLAQPHLNRELRYQSLSQRYVVTDVSSGAQMSYATLYSALRAIGRVQDFMLLPADRVDPDDKHYVAVRVALNREKLPGPLQMIAFWRGDFSLESDWYRWTLK